MLSLLLSNYTKENWLKKLFLEEKKLKDLGSFSQNGEQISFWAFRSKEPEIFLSVCNAMAAGPRKATPTIFCIENSRYTCVSVIECVCECMCVWKGGRESVCVQVNERVRDFECG